MSVTGIDQFQTRRTSEPRPLEKPVVRPRGSESRPDFITSLGESVRENPASATLIALGVAWLFLGGERVSLVRNAARAERNSGESEHRARRSAERANSHAGPYSSRAADKVADALGSAGDAADRAGSKMREVADRSAGALAGIASAADKAGSKVQEAVSTAASRASGTLSAAYQGVGSAAQGAAEVVNAAGSTLYGTARGASEMAVRRSEHLQESLGELIERRPWVLGALGLAIGAGAAVSLPRTRIEDDWLGETTEAVKQQARSVASAQFSSLRARIDSAFDEVAREARAQGLSEEGVAAAIRDFGDRLAKVASTAGDTLKSEIEKNTGGESAP